MKADLTTLFWSCWYSGSAMWSTCVMSMVSQPHFHTSKFGPKNTPKNEYPKCSFVRCWPRRPKSAFARGLDGSENRVILELKFRVDFGPQNFGAFLLRKSTWKNALISIFFSYKEISVRKIALKPLVPVRLRAVLAILRIFAHFWPRFLRRFWGHFEAIFKRIFMLFFDP